jgi:hypothetical protein
MRQPNASVPDRQEMSTDLLTGSGLGAQGGCLGMGSDN